MRPDYSGGGFSNPASDYAARSAPAGSDEAVQQIVLDALSYTPVHPDVLLRQTGLNPRSLTVALLELDLAGRIERHGNEYISLKTRHSETGADQQDSRSVSVR
jgi:DNA processing protein